MNCPGHIIVSISISIPIIIIMIIISSSSSSSSVVKKLDVWFQQCLTYEVLFLFQVLLFL